MKPAHHHVWYELIKNQAKLTTNISWLIIFFLFNREKPVNGCTDNHERNEQATLEWAKSSMKELRIEMRELNRSVNSSQLLRQLHTMRNQVCLHSYYYYD